MDKVVYLLYRSPGSEGEARRGLSILVNIFESHADAIEAKAHYLKIQLFPNSRLWVVGHGVQRSILR